VKTGVFRVIQYEIPLKSYRFTNSADYAVSGLKPSLFFIALNILQLPPGTNLEAIMGSKIFLYTCGCIIRQYIHSSLKQHLRVFTKTKDMYTYTHIFVIWMKSLLYYELVSVHVELRFCLTTSLTPGLHQCVFCIRS